MKNRESEREPRSNVNIENEQESNVTRKPSREHSGTSRGGSNVEEGINRDDMESEPSSDLETDRSSTR